MSTTPIGQVDFIGTGLMVVSTVFLIAFPASAQDPTATYTAAEAARTSKRKRFTLLDIQITSFRTRIA